MPEFNPDEYLNKKYEFNPDEYLAQSPTPQGELGFKARAGLGFMSGENERRKWILQQHPGAKFGKFKDEDIVLIPGENSPRYIDDPSLTMKDIADWAGDIPAIAGGVFAPIIGSGTGEAARKMIGRGFIGETPTPVKPGEIGSDIADIGISAASGGLGKFLGKAIEGQVAKRASQKALQSIGQDTGKKVLAESVEGVSKPGIVGPAAQVAAQEAAQGAKGEVSDIPLSIRLGVDRAKTNVDEAINASRPVSVKELIEQYERDLAKGAIPDLPSADRLKRIEQILPDLENKPLPTHYNMLKNRQNYDVQRVLMKELPGKERQALDAYDAKMKREIIGKIDAEAGNIGRTKAESGQDVINFIQNQYDSQKKALGPLFQDIQKTPFDHATHINSLQMTMAEKLPGYKIGYDAVQDKLVLPPFRPGLGISKKAYGLMDEVLVDLNSKELSFKEMQNLREYLRKEIVPTDPGSTKDIQAIRRVILDHMENLVESRNPDVKVRETFKGWAKNERNLERVESMLGGKLEALEAELKANPSRVFDNFFNNPNTVAATKEFLGPEKFAKVADDYLALIRNAASDSSKNNELSLHKFATAITKKRDVLEAALGKEKYERLLALGDLGKIIPEMPSVNPSGTGKSKTIMEGLQYAGKTVMSGGMNLPGDIFGAVKESLEASKTQKEALKQLEVIFSQHNITDQPAKKNFADKMLPIVSSPYAKAALRAIIQGKQSTISGPWSKDGLLESDNLKGPGGQ